MVGPGDGGGDEQHDDGGGHPGFGVPAAVDEAADEQRTEDDGEQRRGEPQEVDKRAVGLGGLFGGKQTLDDGLERGVGLVVRAHAEVAAGAHLQQFGGEELDEDLPAHRGGDKRRDDGRGGCGEDGLPFLADQEVEQEGQRRDLDSGGDADEPALGGEEALAGGNKIGDDERHDHDVDLGEASLRRTGSKLRPRAQTGRMAHQMSLRFVTARKIPKRQARIARSEMTIMMSPAIESVMPEKMVSGTMNSAPKGG